MELKEINLRTYKAIQKVITEGEDINKTELLKAFYGVDGVRINSMKATDINRLSDEILKALEIETAPLQRMIRIGGVNYGFIPNFDDMRYGEMLDLNKYLSDIDTLELAMAVCYRPIKKSVNELYEIEPYNGTGNRPELMNHLPMDVVLGATGFFLTLQKDLLQYTMNYIRVEVEANPELKKKVISKVGGETYRSWLQYQNTINAE